LVRAQRALEPRRRRQFLERSLPIELRQEVGDPACCRDAPEGNPARRLAAPKAICTTSRTVVWSAVFFFQKASAAWISSAFICTHWPAYPDQRLLELCQGFEFLKREVLVTERHLPLKLDEGVERETASVCSFGLLTSARAVRRSFVPLRVHHAGSITPKPACSNAIAFSVRNS